MQMNAETPALVVGLVASWRASDVVAEAALAAVGGLLALGAVRAAWTEVRTRRSRPDGDAAQLAGITGAPAALCGGALLVVCLAAAGGGTFVVLTAA